MGVVPKVGIGQGAVVDLTRGGQFGLGGGAVVDFLGGTPDQVPDRYATATPNLSAGPRMVSVVGSDDDIVPAEYSIDSARPGEIEVVPIVGADHFDLIDPASAAWTAVTDVLASELGLRNPSEVDGARRHLALGDHLRHPVAVSPTPAASSASGSIPGAGCRPASPPRHRPWRSPGRAWCRCRDPRCPIGSRR